MPKGRNNQGGDTMYTSCAVPSRRELQKNVSMGPLRSSLDEMSRVLGDFFRGENRYSLWPFSNVSSFGSFSPRVEIIEDDSHIRVDAEIPGIDEKDIDITLTSDAITIRGEKKTELEHSEESVYCSERSYGSFSRVIAIPKGVDPERVDASYHNGVLHISLAKLEGGKGMKKIQVRSH
jgi:HSP20 family protein